MMKVAVMGHGVVGSGVVDLLCQNKDHIAQKTGEDIEIKYILDLREFPGHPLERLFTKDFQQIVNDPDVKVVAEVMGGLHPSYEYVKACLEAGKNVVTSNKELVAAKGAELLAIARSCHVNFMFEASVGGGIPIIRPMNQCMAANKIERIAGILNGTTNFILTKMIEEQMSFEDALTLAQKLGYAERNPSADVDGHDACRKICILASLAYGSHIYPEQVHTEGISRITLEDVAYAENWGGVIKLVGFAQPSSNGRIQIMVAPLFLSHNSQLSHVDDVFNAIELVGDATGEVLFYGKGAGKMPTASAVVADIMDCAAHIDETKYLGWEEAVKNSVLDDMDTSFRMYFRLRASSGKELAYRILPGCEELHRKGQPENETAVVSAKMTVRKLEEAAVLFKEKGAEILNMVRIGDFN